jgi:hypothetical protein
VSDVHAERDLSAPKCQQFASMPPLKIGRVLYHLLIRFVPLPIANFVKMHFFVEEKAIRNTEDKKRGHSKNMERLTSKQ